MRVLRLRVTGILFAWVLSAGLTMAAGAGTNSYPAFSELFELAKKHLAGTSDSQLNRAAVEGFLEQMSPQIRLVEDQPGSNASSPLLSQTNLYESAYGYVRISNVDKGLSGSLQDLLGSIQKTNRIKGLILDLRFGQGQDYLEAAKTADLFLSNSIPLLQWEGRPVLSTAKKNAFRFPVMVLINKETIGAAEALASILRESDIALLIGTPTAGRAASYKIFTLSNGQQVQVAASPLIVGESHQLSQEGLRPDIRVAVNSEDEKAYFKDAYKVIASFPATNTGGSLFASSTNRSSRPRINEAELVRMQREGISPDDEEVVASASSVPTAPTLQDPALLRALDLLKALALHVMK